ncbi:Vacuolar protein sorting-associated protein 8 [Elasticomyces elasticus]|nr:Vacuolar protein sorting-associated protein 8 [Elasticomyces elasticus]
MSSSYGGRDAGGENEDVEADESEREQDARDQPYSPDEEQDRSFGDILDGRDEEENTHEEHGGAGEEDDQSIIHGFRRVRSAEVTSPSDGLELFVSPATPGLESPINSGSIPDDTPSEQESLRSPTAGSLPLARRPVSRTPSGALQPFERRFQARLPSSLLQSPRAQSPAFLTPHSRQSSLSFQAFQPSEDGADTPQPPWEVVRWTKLRKITGQAFSEAGKRNFGRPTYLAVSATIAIGTSKGLILIFDYHQTLRSIIGQGTKAAECGSITSLAISADYSTIAGGHSNGWIFTWELARPAKPFLQIPPLDRTQLSQQHPDGHVAGRAILHVGFLGTRHTALVSADDGGMAFSQLATRGLGAVARNVKTTRLLGRYPATAPGSDHSRKPSSVLAFAPLPLGNVEQATDAMGLTALLTPYLLVIVSTTPIAQTQHKTPRPKEITPHSAMSGCLAWFPAVKLKATASQTEQDTSQTKLVYCWSNVLTVLDVEIRESDGPPEKDKPPSLRFRPRSRWRSEEVIVAVQWLSRSVLGVLTISQRLVIVEDYTLRVTDTFDLLQKHIYHEDLFSRQLNTVIEQLDEEDASMHGVVADAFHMSFRAYKGRLFLLGFNDVAIGTLSNWADRLVALMEEGDFIAAIRLATSYYVGGGDKLTVGLPEDDDMRHAMVKEKLLDMVNASLKYTFGRAQDEAVVPSDAPLIQQLAEECFKACVSMREVDFLFDDVYDWYQGASEEGTFLETLEGHVLENEITIVPPIVVKDLVAHYTSQNRGARLEEMLCRLDPRVMDIDQVTTLCKQFGLYDALIYVWTEALGDFVTPLIDLLTLVKIFGESAQPEDETLTPYFASAMKVFPYLAYTLTGRSYPSGKSLPDREAIMAKSDIYSFLFAGKPTPWPKVSGRVFRTRGDGIAEPSYPYLRLLLGFDAASFMSMLNEAFEDPFLNGPQEQIMNGSMDESGAPKRQVSTSFTRQYIVSILLEVMAAEDFAHEDTVFRDMFIARNLPKFPQFIMLSGSSLRRIVQNLCSVPKEELADDCQLSVEYLLSIYHPPDLLSLVPLFRQAGFTRVLKSTYRSEQQYARLVETYFEDVENRDAVFDCIGDCLRPSAGLTQKQTRDVQSVIADHARDLANISAVRTAQTLKAYAPNLLVTVLDALDEDSQSQFLFLRTLMEPSILLEKADLQAPVDGRVVAEFSERYVRLMCSFDPAHVADYVGMLQSGDLRLEQVLPAMESSGVIDATVVLLARDGMTHAAMDRLVKHLGTLESALTGLVEAASESPDVANTEEAAEDLLEAVQKYTKVGIWLCQGQTKASQQSRMPRPRTNPTWDVDERDLDLDELLWLDLLDTVVLMTKNLTAAAECKSDHPTETSNALDTQNIISTLRSTIQQAFTALLTSTTATSKPPPGQRLRLKDHHTFLHILRAFLTRASRTAPTLSDLRAVLSDIFAAYTYESSILSLSNSMLSSTMFVNVQLAHERRQKGWRPRGMVCEGCKRRAWGTGVGEGVWEAWVEREEEREDERRRKQDEAGQSAGRSRSRGKGRANERQSRPQVQQSGEEDVAKEDSATLVVFACKHVWHRRCLEQKEGWSEEDGKTRRYRCLTCLNGGGQGA